MGSGVGFLLLCTSLVLLASVAHTLPAVSLYTIPWNVTINYPPINSLAAPDDSGDLLVMAADSAHDTSNATIFVFDTSKASLKLLTANNYTRSCSGSFVIPINSTTVLVGCPQARWITHFTNFFFVSYVGGTLHVSAPTKLPGFYYYYATNHNTSEAYFIILFLAKKHGHTELHAVNLVTLEDRLLVTPWLPLTGAVALTPDFAEMWVVLNNVWSRYDTTTWTVISNETLSPFAVFAQPYYSPAGNFAVIATVNDTDSSFKVETLDMSTGKVVATYQHSNAIVICAPTSGRFAVSQPSSSTAVLSFPMYTVNPGSVVMMSLSLPKLEQVLSYSFDELIQDPTPPIATSASWLFGVRAGVGFHNVTVYRFLL